MTSVKAIESKGSTYSRYRHVWPRRYTVDMDGKREQEAIMLDFYGTYRKKLTKWAKQMCKRYHVPDYVHEDLVQSAFLRVHACIPKWEPHKASLWTYCWLGMRKSMLCDIKEYHSNKAYSTKPITRFVVSEEDRVHQDMRDTMCMEDRITLSDACFDALREYPIRGNRFMLYALDETTVSQLARDESDAIKPLSRQAYWNSIYNVREDLQHTLRDCNYG